MTTNKNAFLLIFYPVKTYSDINFFGIQKNCRSNIFTLKILSSNLSNFLICNTQIISLGPFINYVDKQWGGGWPNHSPKCLCYYVSLCSTLDYGGGPKSSRSCLRSLWAAPNIQFLKFLLCRFAGIPKFLIVFMFVFFEEFPLLPHREREFTQVII